MRSSLTYLREDTKSEPNFFPLKAPQHFLPSSPVSEMTLSLGKLASWNQEVKSTFVSLNSDRSLLSLFSTQTQIPFVSFLSRFSFFSLKTWAIGKQKNLEHKLSLAGKIRH